MGIYERIHENNNAELLTAMDTVVRFLNDEDGIEPWLAEGLPDEWDKDDLYSMASDDELMDGACRAFREAMRHMGAGWFTMSSWDKRKPISYGADG